MAGRFWVAPSVLSVGRLAAAAGPIARAAHPFAD
jgi:hypothetical protein